MAIIRINFGVSEWMRDWIRTQPNVVAIEFSETHVIINHNMTGPQLSTFRSNFIDKLAEVI